MAATTSASSSVPAETPTLPPTIEEFAIDVNARAGIWYHGIAKASDRFDQAQNEINSLQAENNSLRLKLNGQQGVVEYQKKEIERLQEKLTLAEIDRYRRKVVSGQNRTKEPETPESAPTQEPAPARMPSTSTPTERSEKLPDPDKFSGQRSDLRRFVSQIHEKMTINRDRYPNPSARMSYVTSRLSGLPYDQILPYIHEGICSLEDYPAILQILERSYGDPNLVQNARSEIFHTHQTNKDFASFFAEFQRRGMESQLPDESLSALLLEVISNELHEMLLHHPAPSQQYHELASHLQKLENLRRNHRRGARSNRYQPSPPAYRPQSPSYAAVARTAPLPPPQRITEPMDLSSTHRPRRTGPSDRETGNCYRCHRAGHLARNCSLPDTRPQAQNSSGRRISAISTNTSRNPSPSSSRSRSQSPQHPRQIEFRSSTPPRSPPHSSASTNANQTKGSSENGVRLG